MNDLYNLDDVINYHINKYRNCEYSRKELYQIAYLGYLKAKNAYDPAKGKMTLIYVSKYIRGELWHTISKTNKIRKTEVSIENDPNASTYMDNIEYVPKEIRVKELKHIEKIKSILHLIPSEEADIIYDYYIAAKTKSLLEIATSRGCTKQRIHQIKAKGIESIKSILGVDYLSKGI